MDETFFELRLDMEHDRILLTVETGPDVSLDTCDHRNPEASLNDLIRLTGEPREVVG